MTEVSTQISPRDTRLPPEWDEPAGTPFAVRAAIVVLAIIAAALAYAAYHLNSVATDEKAQIAQANSKAEQARADLGLATARSADLQLQLDRAKSQTTDLKAQLDKAQARQSDLQSQLERAQADLRVQAEQAKAQVSEMQAEFQAKIKSSDDALSGLRRELDQAKSQTEEMKAQLAKARGDLAKLQPLALKARALPLATSFEKNFWDRALTMHVKNLNPDPLTVRITVVGMGKASAKSATIESGRSLNVGNLAEGAKVVIESAGYDALTVTAQ